MRGSRCSVDSPRDVTTRAAVVWPTGFTSLPATGPCRIFVNAGAENGRAELPLERLASPVSQDPARLLDRHCDVQAVRRALEVLRQRVSPTAFAVFYRRQIQQCSVREVAETMRLTPQQVRVYDHRARRKLGSILLRHGGA